MRAFIRWSAKEPGITGAFQGEGIDEIAVVDKVTGGQAPAASPGRVVMRIDPRHFRPAEAETLPADPAGAKGQLGREPEIAAREMCAEMVAGDPKTARRHALPKDRGDPRPVPLEG